MREMLVELGSLSIKEMLHVSLIGGSRYMMERNPKYRRNKDCMQEFINQRIRILLQLVHKGRVHGGRTTYDFMIEVRKRHLATLTVG